MCRRYLRIVLRLQRCSMSNSRAANKTTRKTEIVSCPFDLGAAPSSVARLSIRRIKFWVTKVRTGESRGGRYLEIREDVDGMTLFV